MLSMSYLSALSLIAVVIEDQLAASPVCDSSSYSFIIFLTGQVGIYARK
jgi:hypothetical protein